MHSLVMVGPSHHSPFARSLLVQAQLSGEAAFLLYDTFGFPLEITQEVAEASGVGVDTEGFKKEMEAQRKRAQDARQEVDLTARLALGDMAEKVPAPTDKVKGHQPGIGRLAIFTARKVEGT